MIFSVVACRCESWTIKKAECRRIDAFELGCWRRLLRVPWTARKSNQSILKETNPEYSLEGLMLKLQSFGHLMQWADSLEKTLPDAGKDWRQKEKRATEDEMVGWHHRSNGHELGQTPGDCDGQGGLVCCSPWGCKELSMTWQPNNNHLWMLDIGNFPFWGAGYFIPKNLLELFMCKHLSYLEAVWSSAVLLLWFVRWVLQSSSGGGWLLLTAEARSSQRSYAVPHEPWHFSVQLVGTSTDPSPV